MAYRARWRECPDETRQPRHLTGRCQVLQETSGKISWPLSNLFLIREGVFILRLVRRISPNIIIIGDNFCPGLRGSGPQGREYIWGKQNLS